MVIFIIKKGIKRVKNGSKVTYLFGDTSGSINIDNLYNIIKTLTSNKEYHVPETLLFSDHVYPYDGEHVLQGGTNAQAIFDYLHNHNIDKRIGVIIISDGYIFDIKNTYGYKNVHWLIIEDGTHESLPKGHKYTYVQHPNK